MTVDARTGGSESRAPMWAGLAAWFGAYALFLRSAGPGFTLEDSTELAVSVATLSNAHPPGFPWYILPGKLFSLIPAGSPAFRLELMSAAAGAFAVLAVFRFTALLAGRAGFTRREAVAGAFSAAALLATSMTMWWESSIAEKYSIFLALFGWSVYALCRFEEEGTFRWLAAAFFLSGLAFGYHFQGVYLAVPLVWAFYRLGGRRPRAMAAFLWLLPVVTRFLYTPVRAAVNPPINWGFPDILSRFIDYSSFRLYQSDRFLTGGAGIMANPGELANRIMIHLCMVPLDEIGWTLVLSLAGAVVVWKWSRRIGAGMLSLALVNLAVSVNYRTSHYGLYDLPYIWLLAALAGLGVARLASSWRPALAAAPLLFFLGFFQHRDFSMRDRDYLASDHMRNLLACAPGQSIVVSGYDAWLFLSWYAWEIAPQDRIQGLYVGALTYNEAERRPLAALLGPRYRDMRYMEEGPAIYRKLAQAAAPRPVFCDYFSILLPSTGLRWRGILLEVPVAPAGAAFDERSADLARKLRLRGLFRPRGWEEVYVARCYGTGFNAQGRAALAAGMNDAALMLARLGKKITPELPEVHDLAARAWFALGREREAEGEWRNALQAGQNTRQVWFEPYLGLSRLASSGRGENRMARLEYLKSAVVAGMGQGSQYAAVANRLRQQARFAEAELVYRQGIAAIFDTYGKNYLDKMKIPQAARAWEDALAWNPADSQAMFSLGRIAMAEERFSDAAVLYQKALKGLPPSAREEGEMDLARARNTAKMIGQLPALEARLEAGDPGPELLCDAGNFFWTLGRVRVAERLYRRSLAKAPRYARAWSNLGSALVEMGRPEEAIASYKKSLEADPGYSGAMLNLARVYGIRGRTREANEWVERALESQPGWPEALVLRDKLRVPGGVGQ